MSKHADIFKLKFLLRNEDQIIVPMDRDKEVKSFIFHNQMIDSSLEDIAKEDFKENLLLELTKGIHLNEFLIQIFHSKFEVFVSSISFELDGKDYSYSYMEDYYLERYWMYDCKLFLDEEYGRIELDIYFFDDYIKEFGMDEENFKFSILGKQLTKADVKIYF